MFTILATLFVASAAPLAHADTHECQSENFITGEVSKVLLNGGFSLKRGPEVYFLDGIMFVAGQADRHLKTGTFVQVFFGGDSADRYGRKPVHVWQSDEWVQGRLLKQGHALVQAPLSGGSVQARDACLAALQRSEKQGEVARAGFWRGETAVFDAANVEKLSENKGKFVLIRGKVLSIGDRSRRLYLNFGSNWSQDFTVSVVKSGSGAFKGDVKRLSGLKNRTIRVRGILEERQGPLIRLFDDSQIEILD